MADDIMTISSTRRNRRSGAGRPRKTHGHSRGGKLSPEYRSWTAMLTRCYNKNATGYKNYGGRGITVCERWRHSFEAFLADMGERPVGMSLERKENQLNYEPGNCIWATNVAQSNNRRSNVLVTLGDETMTVAQWSDRTGLKRVTIHARLRKGWPAEKVLGLPPMTPVEVGRLGGYWSHQAR